ncbi:hypothetical protein EDD11_007853, partial [Mortierella claussenii]
GIITVVDQSLEQEDEALVALRELPKFEPLIVPEQPAHFSLASVFGSLSTTAGSSRHDSTELAFNPNVLVDILVQMTAHNKKCAQDIQQYQKGLALKMKTLDDFTSGAVQDLAAIHLQAKTHSSHLLSVHAMSKQAQTTTTLLHGIINKIAIISDHLPVDASGTADTPSPEKYPTLYKYLHQTPTITGNGLGWMSASSPSPQLTGYGHEAAKSASTASGLALLGQYSSTSRTRPSRTAMGSVTTAMSNASSSSSSSTPVAIATPAQHHPPARTLALSVPKARASMALASSSLTYLPELQEEDQFRSRSFEGSSSSSSSSPFLSTSVSSSPHRHMPRSLAASSLQDPQPTFKASDNLRRLASKAAPPSSSTPPLGQHPPNDNFF